jgi:hypothetical protein
MSLLSIHNNLKKLDAFDIAVEVLEELEDYIADLNRSQLATKGINSDGSDIAPEYSPVTEILKRSKSGTAGITGHVTLFDSGNLHKSIFAEIFPDEVVMDATDEKLSDLEDKYGDKFLGLTDDSIKKLRGKFNPLFIKKFNDAIYK